MKSASEVMPRPIAPSIHSTYLTNKTITLKSRPKVWLKTVMHKSRQKCHFSAH